MNRSQSEYFIEVLQKALNGEVNEYIELCSDPEFSRANDYILEFTLRARGYNNWRSSEESGERFFIEKILAPTNPKLCIDIGANVGGYTIDVLSRTKANVISFEPLPAAFEKLVNATHDFKERVKLENRGIGKEADTLAIHYNPNALAHASFSEDVKKVSYVSNDEKVNVQVITLDTYCEENENEEIDLVKIDTEGFESEVFQGARKTFLSIRPRFIQVEFNWHQLFRNTTLNYFAEQLPAYEVYQLVANGWIKRDPKDSLANIYQYSNFIFVHQT